MITRRALGLGLAFALIPGTLRAQPGVEYQNRGDRYEGIKPRPVSGYDIELLSVLADYRDAPTSSPDRLRARFFLPEAAEVHLTVRELEIKHYYWLDRVRPTDPWRPGFRNEFAWTTEAVLRKLEGSVAPYSLGVVARLGRADPGTDERVAPVILYHSSLPSAVGGYVFAFKTSGDARVSCTIYQEGPDRVVFSEGPLRPRGGRAFAVHWDASRSGAGGYRLALAGYLMDTNQALYQAVRFVHQPAVK